MQCSWIEEKKHYTVSGGIDEQKKKQEFKIKNGKNQNQNQNSLKWMKEKRKEMGKMKV